MWAPQNCSFVELKYHSCGANQYLNYLGKCYGSGSFNTHLTFVKPFKDFWCSTLATTESWTPS